MWNLKRIVFFDKLLFSLGPLEASVFCFYGDQIVHVVSPKSVVLDTELIAEKTLLTFKPIGFCFPAKHSVLPVSFSVFADKSLKIKEFLDKTERNLNF